MTPATLKEAHLYAVTAMRGHGRPWEAFTLLSLSNPASSFHPAIVGRHQISIAMMVHSRTCPMQALRSIT